MAYDRDRSLQASVERLKMFEDFAYNPMVIGRRWSSRDLRRQYAHNNINAEMTYLQRLHRTGLHEGTAVTKRRFVLPM
jgi:hypothetical protein